MERRPGEGGAVHCGEQSDPTLNPPHRQTTREAFRVIVSRALWRGCDVMVEPATAIHPLRHFRSHGEALLFAGQLASLNGWRLFDRVGTDG